MDNQPTQTSISSSQCTLYNAPTEQGTVYNVQCTKVQGTVYNVPCPTDTQYVLSEPVECHLPKGVKNMNSKIRNLGILKTLNKEGKVHLALYPKDNHKWITAADETNKIILITATKDMGFVYWPAVQKAIGSYIKVGYKILLWCNEELYEIQNSSP